MKRWVIIPAGTRSQLPPEFVAASLGVTEICDDLPLSPQLASIPVDAAIAVLAPQSLPTALRENFLSTVNACWLGMKQSQASFGAYDEWLYSAFCNFECLRDATPIDQLEKPHDKAVAIIFGNGPSITPGLQTLAQRDTQIASLFSCWHAAFKLHRSSLVPDFIAHADYIVPRYDFHKTKFPEECSLIVTPACVPDFLQHRTQQTVYAYLPADLPLCWPFQRVLGCQLHHPVYTTVVSLLLNSAIYAGFKTVIAIGVDNGWPPGGPDYSTAPSETIVTVENCHGRKVKTYPVWQHAVAGLEATLRLNPEIEFIQTTKDSMDIEGATYRGIEELFPHLK